MLSTEPELTNRMFAIPNQEKEEAFFSVLDDTDAQLAALERHLRATGLAGMPLMQQKGKINMELQRATREAFEQRVRLSDAAAMVSSILRSE